MPEHREHHANELPSTAPAWWLHGGDQVCPHCGQSYYVEVERHCAACDAPGCPHCLSGHEPLCVDCAKESER